MPRKKKKRSSRRTETNVPQIQEWEVLQKDDGEWEMQVPVCKQGGGRSWIYRLVFGGKQEESEQISKKEK